MAEESSLFEGIDFSTIEMGEVGSAGLQIETVPAGTVEQQTKQETQDPLKKELEDIDFSQADNSQSTEGSVEDENKSSHGTETDDENTSSQETQDNDNSSSSSPIAAFAKFLSDKGVFSSFDETKFKEGADIDTLAEAINEEADTRVSTFIESLPDPIKDVINNYVDGVPLDAIIGVKSRQIEVNSIDPKELEDNTDLAKQIVIANLKETTSFTEKKINKLVQEWEDTGKLLEEAQEGLSSLKEVYSHKEQQLKKETQAAQQMAEQQRQQQLQMIKDSIEKTEEVIPGMKLNKIMRQKIEQSMTTPIGTDKNGNPVNKVMTTRMKNPLAFDMMLHTYHEMGLFNIDEKGNMKPDWSKVKTTAKTTAVKELETGLAQFAQKQAGYNPGKAAVDKPVDKNDMDFILKNLFF